MNEIITDQEWYEPMIEECRAIIVEGIFRSRMELIEAYHGLGKRILEEERNFTKSGYTIDGMSQRVATSLEKSQRTIEQAVQFAKKFPDLENWLGEVSEGKNISWHKIVRDYLPNHKEHHEHDFIEVQALKCRVCGILKAK